MNKYPNAQIKSKLLAITNAYFSNRVNETRIILCLSCTLAESNRHPNHHYNTEKKKRLT